MIIHIILVSLLIVGVNAITRQGKVLSLVSKALTNRNGNRFELANVICECCTCMASLYGISYYSFEIAENVVLDKRLLVIVAAIAVSISGELLLAYRILRKESDRRLNSFKIAGKISSYLYLILIAAFVVTNQMYYGLFFIVAVAGLSSIIDRAMIALEAIRETKIVSEDQNQILNYIASELEREK